MGNEIVIPERVERVVIASVWPLASVYCLYMGSTEKLVGLDPAIISAARNSALIKVFPDIVNIPSGFAKNGNINYNFFIVFPFKFYQIVCQILLLPFCHVL